MSDEGTWQPHRVRIRVHSLRPKPPPKLGNWLWMPHAEAPAEACATVEQGGGQGREVSKIAETPRGG